AVADDFAVRDSALFIDDAELPKAERVQHIFPSRDIEDRVCRAGCIELSGRGMPAFRQARDVRAWNFEPPAGRDFLGALSNPGLDCGDVRQLDPRLRSLRAGHREGM